MTDKFTVLPIFYNLLTYNYVYLTLTIYYYLMKTHLFFLSFFISLNTFSQWNNSNSINTPVGVAPKSQSNVHCVADSKGGVVMTWDDNRNSLTTLNDIYAQRLNAGGVRKWVLYGSVICNNAATQKSPSITEAGNGSVIITWEDNRAGNYDIYAQKIDSSGTVLWATNGIAVCNKTTNQKNPKIVGDNAGGAIVVWEDSLNFYWDVYAQRISSTGSLMWTAGGVPVCSAANTQVNPKLDVDGLGGAIFTWQDKRNNSDYDIYAQRVDASGTVQWTANGVAICNAINTQSNPRIEPDGANGAIIGWVDKRNSTDYNIFAQRINSTGTIQWTANGVSVCAAANNQSALDMKYIGSTGVVLSWKDDRVNTNEIYAQLVSLSGTPQLTTNGIKLSNALKSINPNTVSDGSGGAIIAWQDSTSLGWDITSQKLNSAGVIQWPNGGVIVSNAGDDQINASQVADGNGGAIYTWDDHRNGSDYDIYAHHLYFDGNPMVGIKESTANNTLQSSCFPNPISFNTTIQLKNNTLYSDWDLTIFDSFGRLIQTQHLKSNESYNLNSYNYEAGVYFYFINFKNQNTSTKGSFISVK